MFIRDAIQRSHNINDYVNWGAGLLLIIVIVVAFTKKFTSQSKFSLRISNKLLLKSWTKLQLQEILLAASTGMCLVHFV